MKTSPGRCEQSPHVILSGSEGSLPMGHEMLRGIYPERVSRSTVILSEAKEKGSA